MLQRYDHDKKELNFIDRTTIFNLIDAAYREVITDHTVFKVIALDGMGGIGKSRLLEECIKFMCIPEAKPIHITLEITSRDDLCDILIKFRKALPKRYQYPLFDYAMIVLWNNLNVGKLNEEFIASTKRDIINFVKLTLDVRVGAKSGIPIASAVDLFLMYYDKIKKMYNDKVVSGILDGIANMRTHELLNVLPVLLAKDMQRVFANQSLILIIDAFKYFSQNVHDATSWLGTLIKNIGYGVFIVTSREKIIWPDDLKKHVIDKPLCNLPKEEVHKELLTEYNFPIESVENIITITECIPIYLNLAVNTILNSPDNLISRNEIFFKSKEDIVFRFLAHLSEKEREIIEVLAVVQIFDADIFEHLVKELNLQISILEFENISKRSIITNIEHDNYFYKMHDVISQNISFIIEKYKKQKIIKCYLQYIHMRGCMLYSSIQINMLFKHVLSLCINNDVTLSMKEHEELLDIFFVIKESLLPFHCQEIVGFDKETRLADLFYFLKALSEEREKSNVRLSWLQQIDVNSCEFGKHKKSLQLMKGYLQALCDGSQQFKSTVCTLNENLTESEKQEWYYGQIKIFLGDCCISYGQFKTGIGELETYFKLLPKLIGKENDSFQVIRHIAHGYRFNMMLDKAEELYSSLIYGEQVFPTALQKVYILTNLCETYCYFKPLKLFEIQREALIIAHKFNDLKSKGKIYYSLAIACLLNKKYKKARKYIRKSLYLNQLDGYQSGKLYAHMAQAYYEYALNRTISSSTLHIIKNLQKKIEVYSCFFLPLAIMCEEYEKLPQIRKSQGWIDFDYTAATYRKFLDSLISSE